ncbi:MAG: ferrous iron transport protein A [Burkholderiaceae bacterium]|nr:ferrous iron transport protein A [Burkholderiaceae bacterium]
MALSQLALGQAGRVQALRAAPGAADWPRQLAELGFEPGEPVQLLHRAPFGGDPLVVRVGGSTYALRRAEADCVLVSLQADPSPSPR